MWGGRRLPPKRGGDYPCQTVRPLWIDPARFRRNLTRAIALPLVVMAGFAAGWVYLLDSREAAALALVGGGLLAMLGRRWWLELSESYRQAIASSEQQSARLVALNEELERRVADRTSKLEAANRELEAFSYSVSHDLRSPLRHISGFSQLLRRSAGGDLDPQGVHYLDNIAEAARRAAALVDDLLAFSRMQRAELRNVEVDMGRLFEEVRAELAPECAGRIVHWRLGPLPQVRGDGSMLRQVVRNLLSNALKYTRPRTTAQVEIGCRQEGSQYVFAVKDNGVGFDMVYVDRLFGVFKRLHREDEFEGNGIGLANVRSIVSRHGGQTWAEGQPGEGATFYFSLPVQPSAAVSEVRT
jgi:light-regulated signal transduction histidine kinase (bacteriophytochrome)